MRPDPSKALCKSKFLYMYYVHEQYCLLTHVLFTPTMPCSVISHAGFPPPLLREIVKVGYESPTPIQVFTHVYVYIIYQQSFSTSYFLYLWQAQALPVAMSGRDIIGK